MRWDLATHMQWPFFFKHWMFTVLYNLVNGAVIGRSTYQIVEARKTLRRLKREQKERSKYPLLLYISDGFLSWMPTEEEYKDLPGGHPLPGLVTREIPRNWCMPRRMWHDYGD